MPFDYYRDIALIGSSYSGKTAFLTMLLWNLKHHDPSTFRLAHGQVSDVEILSGEGPGNFKTLAPFEPFDFHAARSKLLREGIFPAKTCAARYVDVRFGCEKFKVASRARLRIFDFPGERFADLSMYSMNYEEWSNYVLTEIKRHAAFWHHNKSDYLGHLETVTHETPAESVTLAYRREAVRFLERNRLFISPSSLLLSERGTLPQTGDELIKNFSSGLKDQEFAPLDQATAARAPELAAKFRAHYANYKAAVVVPLFSRLFDCQRVIYLLDVMLVLLAGAERYTDEKRLFQNAAQSIGLPRGPWSRAKRALSGIVPWRLQTYAPDTVVVCATKSDLVNRNEVGRLTSLAEDLVVNAIKGAVRRDPNNRVTHIGGARGLVTALSAIPAAAEHDPATGSPRGVLLQGGDGKALSRGGPPVNLNPSSLPEKWPPHWDPANFHFPAVHPPAPIPGARDDYVLPSHGLDEVLRFAMDEETFA